MDLDSGTECVMWGYGNVLKMQIESFDGGTHAANVLKNDQSVYYTPGDWCDLIFKHEGGVVFNIKEFIIKTPRQSRSFAKAREGMVFVSMASDPLLTRLA